MPIQSKAQLRLMYAAKQGIVKKGIAKDSISKKSAEKMIKDTPKESFKNLPQRVKEKKSVKKNKA